MVGIHGHCLLWPQNIENLNNFQLHCLNVKMARRLLTLVTCQVMNSTIVQTKGNMFRLVWEADRELYLLFFGIGNCYWPIGLTFSDYVILFSCFIRHKLDVLNLAYFHFIKSFSLFIGK